MVLLVVFRSLPRMRLDMRTLAVVTLDGASFSCMRPDVRHELNRQYL
jgi:hypothetical protein